MGSKKTNPNKLIFVANGDEKKNKTKIFEELVIVFFSLNNLIEYLKINGKKIKK